MSRKNGNQDSFPKSEKMQRYYAERETTGPEFDDRLIKLVRANPAIYDVSHPHYRRNPVRVDIWDRIANELGASSRFLQTKWKNIRYNYLQEVKAIETGQANPNVRKRRFTEDLSFLQNTAQTYNVKKSQSYVAQQNGMGSDNDSNSFLYPDPEHLKIDASEGYDIIDLDNSDDGTNSDDNEIVPELQLVMEDSKPQLSLPTTLNGTSSSNHSHEHDNASSPASSPLLTPLVVMDNGYGQEVHLQQQQEQEQKPFKNSSLSNGEVTIEPIFKPAAIRRVLPSDFLTNPFKRKASQAPLQTQASSSFNDPIELYCLSLVDTLRSMRRSERERVKFEFASILKDAKYKDES
ncbi:uncharacterized protein LOC6609734 [Drosophila sechellia]|uniref:uncharacterized protein LOC6609734 n=1 Tax=Drosophila sechellia TaxID=7238 RepID=UPI0013DDF49F|nr:uncharacterized protein LOC6609734 [Drosophila sechellia]